MEDRFAPRTDADRAWSEYNHHIAGVFVLTMGLLAIVSRSRPGVVGAPLAPRLPGAGRVLLVRNDPGAWPLGPQGFWEGMP